jgi:undecaprenyl diphosphate synthase
MNLIKHVAIIMDGNGRWGIKKKNSRNEGHKAGLKTIENIITETIRHKIKYLTLYAFSTENWKRPKSEINFLLNLLQYYLINKIKEFKKNNIKFNVIGNKNSFSKKLKKTLINTEKETSKCSSLQINLALNYGSKDEIVRTINRIKKKIKYYTVKNIDTNLYTYDTPDPDLLIRTGNTKRLSNFLLWQIAYTEIFFEKKLWPDFTKKDYTKILSKFKKLKRNFGNI